MKYRLVLSLLVGFFSFSTLQNVQAQACNGVDLRSTLEASEREKINEETASIPNPQGRFWKIEKPGISPSWLLGTMHVADQRIRLFSDSEYSAFDRAERIALELDEILDAPAATLKILGHTETFTYSEDNALKNALPAPQFALFEEVLERRGLSYALLSRTKPWLIWAMLSMPPCLVEEESKGKVAFDAYLGKLAQADGKEVIGLETMEEQLTAIDSLPLNFYVTSIIQLGSLNDRLNDYHETMIALYLDGEIGAIMPTMMALMVRDLEAAGLGDAEMPNPADMLSFETILLDDRNIIMAQRAAPLLEQGNTFIAVGALHLVGETGLVEQFRRMGYQVTSQSQ